MDVAGLQWGFVAQMFVEGHALTLHSKQQNQSTFLLPQNNRYNPKYYLTSIMEKGIIDMINNSEICWDKTYLRCAKKEKNDLRNILKQKYVCSYLTHVN